MKLDFEKIDKFIESRKTDKPEFLNVSIDEWECALNGYRVSFGESVSGEESTDHVWSLIYFSCGKFVSTNPATRGKNWDGKLIWTGGPVPEPSHDVFWHIKCESKDIEKRKVVINE